MSIGTGSKARREAQRDLAGVPETRAEGSARRTLKRLELEVEVLQQVPGAIAREHALEEPGERARAFHRRRVAASRFTPRHIASWLARAVSSTDAPAFVNVKSRRDRPPRVGVGSPACSAR